MMPALIQWLVFLHICLLGALLIHIYTKRREHTVVAKMETAGS